ncbi:MAG: oxidoreductase, partial [Deltaproteobacteria bacterium]
MKICVYGAGAIGGYMGAKLAQSGADVTLIARGPHLEAMRKNGLTLRSEGETINVRPRVTQSSREVGPQDYVILSVKA